MKRYLAMFGDVYYPSTGSGDFCGSYDTLEEAKNKVGSLKECEDWRYEWGEVYDLQEEKVVCEFYEGYKD